MPSFLTRYISRGNPRDNTRHVILSTTSTRPTDFAAQLNVSLANGWGIVRTVADLCMKQPEGKYVLVKDPNKVRQAFLSAYVYDIPLVSPRDQRPPQFADGRRVYSGITLEGWPRFTSGFVSSLNYLRVISSLNLFPPFVVSITFEIVFR